MRRDDETARNIMSFNDFYTTSECRDLLLHVQEHRMTLPAIKRFLAKQNLQFIGFEIDRRTAKAYAARFPNDPAMIDLDQCTSSSRRTRIHLLRCTGSGWVRLWREPAVPSRAILG
jgi:hypothetical protein